jgi:hypothetical protein
VLAMAGVDYSRVREPNFDEIAEEIRQERNITAYIERLTGTVLENYFKPSQGRELLYPGDYVTRKKSVFYDTDGIQESQVESLMRCNDCAGLLVLESASSVNPLCLGIEIPAGACPSCRDEGLKYFDRARKQKKYAVIQIINRVNKEYLRV